MKYFNTTGPIQPDKHYYISHRLDWQKLESFIEKQYYFILHAPRQSGKTSAIFEFVKYLNEGDKYTALYINTGSAHIAVDDITKAMRIILQNIKRFISQQLTDQMNIISVIDNYLESDGVTETMLQDLLSEWAHRNSKPLILFFDEIDGMVGDSLISLLKQIRSGFPTRPDYFPQSICFIGVRDLRDYKIQSKSRENTGLLYSPFNIKSDSLRLNDFTHDEVQQLYRQHTDETGQTFSDDAIEMAFHLTQGQPWLVNALAYQVCSRTLKDSSQEITQAHIFEAKKNN